MKRKNLFKLQEGISMCGNLKGLKFAYCMAKNKKKIDEEIEFIKEFIKPSEEYLDYDRKRIELAKSCAKVKDGKEEVAVKDGVESYVMENQEDFNKKVKELQEEYNDALEGRKKQIEDYGKLIEEEIEIELCKIKEKNLPEDITTNQFASISEFIID